MIGVMNTHPFALKSLRPGAFKEPSGKGTRRKGKRRKSWKRDVERERNQGLTMREAGLLMRLDPASTPEHGRPENRAPWLL